MQTDDLLKTPSSVFCQVVTEYIYICIYIQAGHVARMGLERFIYRVLVGKPEGKRPMGRPRIRWEDNIKMNLQEMECGSMDWVEVA